ncbi:oligopeptide transport system ATP-binding protein [Paenibacillus sp. JGP012]|uniref:ABC transporter ATP-binding protein n=1 Tax=Paenibacillus sp. JGP012 TaxID=2735914 RepID=UPI001611C5C0|nr:ABC transporter ATP-binding protein [Paenibacillus sp. JGP012]MBB6021876.1 oligopeptide transport system ATP-binding protein [Paenibacillus sp. JGP012]
MRKITEGQPILGVSDLSISAVHHGHSHRITKDISFNIHIGETLAIVGESGSGKSVTASAVSGLLSKPLVITHGQIVFQGINLLESRAGQVKSLRGKEIGCVFQDYRGSFTPFMKVGHQLMEVIRTHTRATRPEAKEMALDWLQRVNLPAERSFRSYPFQLSGGQLQRVALAAALMLKPALLIADEPITALDVITGQAIMDLMEELQCEVGCAILLISHDLRQVVKRSHRIAVMQKGHLVETGTRDQIKNAPHHPYTQALLKACPRIPHKQHTSPEVTEVWG